MIRLVFHDKPIDKMILISPAIGGGNRCFRVNFESCTVILIGVFRSVLISHIRNRMHVSGIGVPPPQAGEYSLLR